MSQDNKKSIVMYQGDGSNRFFPVPMTKGKYGTISVAFVRRGLDQYEYNPTTWGLNGNLFAWDLSDTKVYTDTATPAIGATIYDQYGVDTGDTVSAVSGDTITVNTDVYTRDSTHDVKEDSLLTWTGATLELGDYIVIQRTTTRTQPFEFPNNQKHIEKSDDNLERQIQEISDRVDNALTVDPTHTIDSNKMDPQQWLETILRSVDKSVRGFRYLNGWLDYSLDDPNIADVDKTWTHLLNTENIKSIRERSRIEDGETIYYTEYLAQDGSWKTLSDPHKWDNMTLADLADTDFSGLSAGNFIMFDGLKWKNVYSSATASWGTILGTLADQADLKDALDAKVNIDGTSIMTAPLKFMSGSLRGAVGPYFNGVGFWKLDSQANLTQIASLSDSQFIPTTTNAIDLGNSTRKWKDLYLGGKAFVATLNNGYDLAVPAKSGTLATMGDVELAARSGRMLTDQGVWYAKIYAASTVPTGAEYDGTNYADFSQVDADNNPVIKIYTGASGAWTLTDTITPPAEYDGYVPITSKIWDIAEQTGQQGGRVLWNHTSKEFTPYPLIVSFHDVALTGTPTAPTPDTDSPSNQIATKEYVDNHVPTNISTYHPDLFDWKWADRQVNDVQWLRADTWSWHNGSMYKAAYNDLFYDIYTHTTWYVADQPLVRTYSPTPAVGDTVYYESYPTTEAGTITAYDDVNNTITVSNGYTYAYNSNQYIAPTTEVVAGISVTYYPGASGHKIVPRAYESAVSSIYNNTGEAWYYVIDVPNKQFKLPRRHSTRVVESVVNNDGSWYRLYADGWVEQGGIDSGSTSSGTQRTVSLLITMSDAKYCLELTKSTSENVAVGVQYTEVAASYFKWNIGYSSALDRAIRWYVCGMSAVDMSAYQGSEKHLYFYVGEFTQSAITNTAGLNAEMLASKADADLKNILPNIDYVVETGRNESGSDYTWYRKYKSGWVEQGGYLNNSSSTVINVTLPVAMADTKYTVTATLRSNTVSGSGGSWANSNVLNASQIQIVQDYNNTWVGQGTYWEAKGMSASLPVYFYGVPGTYTLTLPAGSYDFELSAGGGGGAAALKQNNEAGASGGTGAYGSFSLTLAATDTLTIVVGAGGTGATIIGGTAASTGGGTTSITTTGLGTIVTLTGGGRGYAHATNNGDSASVGAGGTVTTTLGTHDLHAGVNGVSATTASGTQSAGYTTNPSPYVPYGYGGGFSYTSGESALSATNGGAGYVSIKKTA